MNTQRKIEPIVHLAFWILLLILSVSLSSQLFPIKQAIGMSFKTIGILAIVAYLNSLFVIPQFFQKGNFGQYFLALLILICLSLIVNASLSNLLYPDLYKQFIPKQPIPPPMRPGVNPIFRQVPIFFMFILVLFISTTYQLAREFRLKERHNDLLQKEKIRHELNFLRAQINPHFLFNALNNLHALLQLHPNKAGDFVLKLGDMLRYVLEGGKEDKVRLREEIHYIQNYIYFQKQKDENFQNISFCYSGEASDGYFIEPMLLIPFVENAFQHSYAVSSKNRFIKIKLKLSQGIIHFQLENSLANQPAPNSLSDRKEGGVGLRNVQRRLALLYPNNYELWHGPKANSYHINLIIQTS